MPVNALDVRTLLLAKRWSVTALALRWGFSRRYVTSVLGNKNRGQMWDDALIGLPVGPGFYVRAALKPAVVQSKLSLNVGDLVASEAEFETFAYGARGIVAEVQGHELFVVVWDGGTVMSIDSECLSTWVVDIGLTSPFASTLSALSAQQRIQFCKTADLYA